MEKEIETLKNEHPQLYEKIIDILQEISDISNSCPQYASLVQYMIDERLKKQNDKKVVKTYDELKLLIDNITRVNPHANLNFIDVSQITKMYGLFYGSNFNGDISEWDVSNVTDMEQMFEYSKFNGDISKWDVSNVKSMHKMFADSVFDGDISNWDVSNVESMYGMFMRSKFNKPIGNWNVSKVLDSQNMFCATNFNQDISKWKFPTQCHFTDMFYLCPIKNKYKPILNNE